MMAEIFGAVGAGVGVAAAAGQLIDGIVKLDAFCSQIRNIPDDVQTAVDDLATMVEVLEFVQLEMGHDILPFQPSNRSSSMKVLLNLQQSSLQVREVLEEMQIKLGKRKYWGRVKAVAMTKKLERAAKRVENAQRMVLILLAAENRDVLLGIRGLYSRLMFIRMTFRQSFNAQSREITAISTRILSITSASQLTDTMSRNTRAIEDTDGSNATNDPDSAEPASRQPIQRTSRAKGRDRTVMKLKLSSLFLNPVWEFSVNKANQGWNISLRSYNIRPRDAPIFKAISNGDLSQVRELLQSGGASIWDRDYSGDGVLHFAARSCRNHGSAIIEYLVKSGADIYDANFRGFPPYFSFHGNGFRDEQTGRLVAGYKAFTSHRDWIPSRPTIRVPFVNFKATSDIIDTFPIFDNPPEEIICSVLHEMWPPWKDMPPGDRIKTLFPDFTCPAVTGIVVSPLSIRACLSREFIQRTFADWDTKDKHKLIKYTFNALTEQLVGGVEKGIEEARLFLKDIHMTNSLINMLPKEDYLNIFVRSYMCERIVVKRIECWSVETCTNFVQQGLKHYISELMLLGIDMATIIEIERNVLARQKERTRAAGFRVPHELSRIIGINYGPKADDWHLWLSNPLDEWAGEFWDMLDHPERAIPGAWEEY
jgi:hypothetical protein